MIVTLIGYRGCGKTTVGRLLSDELGCRFVDADVEIERAAGKSIREIFTDDGETVFRDLEEQTIRQLLESHDLVLSAGGGAVLRESTRERMRNAGPVIWLKASAETLFARIQGDDTTAGRRPNLTSSGGLEEVRTLLATREPIYRAAASCEIDTENRDFADIVADIVTFLSTGSGGAR